MKHLYQLILASKSPRRKELLSHLGIPFRVQSSQVAELSTASDPQQYCQELALLKAKDVYQQLIKNENESKQLFFVMGADTIVTLGNKIFEKPKDILAARDMLTQLSGKTHVVYTGVSFVYSGNKCHPYQSKVFQVASEVTFSAFDAVLIDEYLATGDSLDKAGGYGIQGKALSFINNINGSYANVVGLPLSEVVEQLRVLFTSDHENWKLAFHLDNS